MHVHANVSVNKCMYMYMCIGMFVYTYVSDNEQIRIIGALWLWLPWLVFRVSIIGGIQARYD